MVLDSSGARALRMTRAPFVSFVTRGVVLFIVLSAIGAAGCASRRGVVPEGTLDPDKFLFQRGTEALEKKRWLTSREYFRTLIDTYPQSQLRAEAKLGIGDTYLGEKTAEAFVLAINEFREFLNFYPTHRRAHYAQYKLGMAHYLQMRGPERDQTETRDAIVEFTAYLQRYPKDDEKLTAEVREKLREARDRLSTSEFRVGYFYYRTQKWYPGAIDRFVAVLRDDPEYTNRDAVYFYLADSLIKIGRPAEALPYLDRLLKEFVQSEHLEMAKKLADQIRTELAKKAGGQNGA